MLSEFCSSRVTLTTKINIFIKYLKNYTHHFYKKSYRYNKTGIHHFGNKIPIVNVKMFTILWERKIYLFIVEKIEAQQKHVKFYLWTSKGFSLRTPVTGVNRRRGNFYVLVIFYILLIEICKIKNHSLFGMFKTGEV